MNSKKDKRWLKKAQNDSEEEVKEKPQKWRRQKQAKSWKWNKNLCDLEAEESGNEDCEWDSDSDLDWYEPDFINDSDVEDHVELNYDESLDENFNEEEEEYFSDSDNFNQDSDGGWSTEEREEFE